MTLNPETVPARHETPDLAELRRLAEAATPGPWRTEYLMGAGNDLLTAIVAGRATPDDLRVIGSTLAERDGKFIAAAVNALPGLLGKADALLDEADALRAELAHMTEARDNARAEVERLTAMVEAVREYAAARQANIDHGPLLSARKAAHDALLAALARLDEEPQP